MDGNAQNMFHGNHQGDPYYRYDPAAAAAAAAAAPRAMGPPGGYPPRHRPPHPLQQQPQYPSYQPPTENLYGMGGDQHTGMGMGDLTGWGSQPTPGQAGAYPGPGLGAYGHPQAAPTPQRQAQSQPGYRQHIGAYPQQEQQKHSYPSQQSLMSGIMQQPGYVGLSQQQSQQQRISQHYPQAGSHPMYSGTPQQQPTASAQPYSPYAAAGMQHQPSRAAQHVGYGHGLDQSSYGQHVPTSAAPSHHMAAQQQSSQLPGHNAPPQPQQQTHQPHHGQNHQSQQQATGHHSQQQPTAASQSALPPGLANQAQQQAQTASLNSHLHGQGPQTHPSLMHSNAASQHQAHAMVGGYSHHQQAQQQQQQQAAQQPSPYLSASKHQPAGQLSSSPQYRAPFPQLSPQMSPRPPQMSPHPQMSPRSVMSPAKPQQQQQQQPPQQVNPSMASIASPRPHQQQQPQPQNPPTSKNSGPVNTLQALEQMVMPGQQNVMQVPEYAGYRQPTGMNPMGPRMPVSPQHHQQWPPHMGASMSQQHNMYAQQQSLVHQQAATTAQQHQQPQPQHIVPPSPQPPVAVPVSVPTQQLSDQLQHSINDIVGHTTPHQQAMTSTHVTPQTQHLLHHQQQQQQQPLAQVPTPPQQVQQQQQHHQQPQMMSSDNSPLSDSHMMSPRRTPLQDSPIPVSLPVPVSQQQVHQQLPVHQSQPSQHQSQTSHLQLQQQQQPSQTQSHQQQQSNLLDSFSSVMDTSSSNSSSAVAATAAHLKAMSETNSNDSSNSHLVANNDTNSNSNNSNSTSNSIVNNQPSSLHDSNSQNSQNSHSSQSYLMSGQGNTQQHQQQQNNQSSNNAPNSASSFAANSNLTSFSPAPAETSMDYNDNSQQSIAEKMETDTDNSVGGNILKDDAPSKDIGAGYVSSNEESQHVPSAMSENSQDATTDVVPPTPVTETTEAPEIAPKETSNEATQPIDDEVKDSEDVAQTEPTEIPEEEEKTPVVEAAPPTAAPAPAMPMGVQQTPPLMPGHMLPLGMAGGIPPNPYDPQQQQTMLMAGAPSLAPGAIPSVYAPGYVGYPPGPISHHQERAALQQQLQELYCSPPSSEQQEKIIRLQERLNMLQQHESTDQCNGGPSCILASPLYNSSQMVESPQVSSTTGRGRGKGSSKPRKPRAKKGEKGQAQAVAANSLESELSSSSIPPTSLPVSEDCVTQGAGDTSVSMMDFNESCDVSQDVSSNDLDTSTDGGKKKKPRKPKTPKDPNKSPKEKVPKEKKKKEPKEPKEPKDPNDPDKPKKKRGRKSTKEADTKRDGDAESSSETMEENKPETTSDEPKSTVEDDAPDYDDIPVSKITKAGDDSSGERDGDKDEDDESTVADSATPSSKRKRKSVPGGSSRKRPSVGGGRSSKKSRKNRGRIVPESDGEADDMLTTPPPSPPPDSELDSSKRRSTRNTQRKKYIDDVMLRFSDDESGVVSSSPIKKEKKASTSAAASSGVSSDAEKGESNAAPDVEKLLLEESIIDEPLEKEKPPEVAKPNYVYVNTGDEDSMVVQFVLAVRMGKRELKPPEEKKPVMVPEPEVKTEEEKEKPEKEEKKEEGAEDDEEKKETEQEDKEKEDADKTEQKKEEVAEEGKESSGDDENEEKEGVEKDETGKAVKIAEKDSVADEERKEEKMEVDESESKIDEEDVEKSDKSDKEDDEEEDKEKDKDSESEEKEELKDDVSSKEKKSEEKSETEAEAESSDEDKEKKAVVEKPKEKVEEKPKPEPVYIDIEEYYVKYRNFSYLHCEWRTEEELFKGDRRVSAKIRRFEMKRQQQMNIFENIEEEPFNPDFVEVDRILDMSEHTDSATGEVTKHYLVKWKSLPYEDCTWELEEDCDEDKIEQYHRFSKIPPKSEWKPKKRPNPEQWKKLEKTPIYKNNNSLRPYQLEGLNWLKFSWYNSHNCILADEMGLGKTIQSLTFVHSVWDYGIRGPFLVIAPLSTIPNWQREFESWTDMNIVVYHGSVTSKQMIQDYEFFFKTDSGKGVKDLCKFNVLITTFEMIVTDYQDLRNFNWRLCVIDEAHRLKNRNCKLLEGLRQLNLEHRVLLSGTPLQNNISELFSLLNFLEPTQFACGDTFMREFGSLKTEEEVQKLQALLKPMMLRRLKDDVEKSLAPKEETIIEVELTNIQKKYYRGILEQNFSFLKKGTTSANIPNLMNTMMELRKCCIHPYLLNGAEEQIQYDYRLQHGDDQESYYKNLIQSAGKMVLIDKLLPKLKANGHRVLIFSQMVRCLDILEDYLMYKKYTFERIDGRIRGNLRQAAIDRYSRPDSDRFVFLLCTKAGGLGINLTAADTVIIYDSDWNPQNDLQAQARCHRIGQKKMVKIYRLLCRNTYEREMFDKASLKLGLDKAILQSMNTTQGGKETGNRQLSKKEIEDLLKKGAYGAVMDDDAGDKFCEEDIDSILKRRTQVITIESEKGSTFSKASFAASGNRSDIGIDDPDFWNKWAKKADIDPDAAEKDETEDLVLSEPRRRTQIKRYGHEDVMDMSEDSSNENSDEDSIGLRSRRRKEKLANKRSKQNDDYIPRERDTLAALGLEEIQYGNWAKSECFKVEKGLLSFGWGRWNDILDLGQFKRGWRDVDIEECARIILLYCLQVYKGDEKIKNFIWDLITPTEDGEVQKISRDHSGLHNLVPRGRNAKGRNGGKTVKEGKAKSPEREKIPGAQDILDPNHWSKDEKFDAESFLEGPYKKHLGRHANKVLLRVRMLYYIQHEVIGENVAKIVEGVNASELPIRPPPTPDQTPCSWWNPNCCDKSLLVGTYKHGCEMYRQIRADPSLCFHTHIGPGDDSMIAPASNHNIPIEDDVNSKHEDGDDGDEDGNATKDSDSKPSAEAKEGDSERPSSSGLEEEESGAGSYPPTNQPAAPGDDTIWPSMQDLNTRLRRVITAYQRNYKKEELKQQQKAKKMERQGKMEQQAKERERQRLESIPKKWNRREEYEFLRVLTGYGVDLQQNMNILAPDWLKFKAMARLERKSDETLSDYYKVFIAMCKRQAGVKLSEGEKGLEGIIEDISEDHAKLILDRLELLSKLREIARHPMLEDRLKLCQNNFDTPDWWESGRHDKELVAAVLKHGLYRSETFIFNDPNFSFSESERRFIRALEEQIQRSIKLEPAMKPECDDDVTFVKEEVKHEDEALPVEIDKEKDIVPEVEKVTIKDEETAKPEEEEVVKEAMSTESENVLEKSTEEVEEKSDTVETAEKQEEVEKEVLKEKAEEEKDEMETEEVESCADKIVEETSEKSEHSAEADKSELEEDKENEGKSENLVEKDSEQMDVDQEEIKPVEDEKEELEREKSVEKEDAPIDDKKESTDKDEDKKELEEKVEEDEDKENVEKKDEIVEEEKVEKETDKEEDKVEEVPEIMDVDDNEKKEETGDKTEEVDEVEKEKSKSPEPQIVEPEGKDAEQKVEAAAEAESVPVETPEVEVEPKKVEDDHERVEEESKKVDEPEIETSKKDDEVLDLASSSGGDPDDDEVMKEKEKAVEEECKKQAADLKARFPDLEVIQPQMKLKNEKDKPKLEMMMVRWYKDFALEKRISHIVSCVETNQWPVGKNYSAYSGCQGVDLDVPLHDTIMQNVAMERRSETPDVITITTDQGVPKHLQAQLQAANTTASPISSMAAAVAAATAAAGPSPSPSNLGSGKKRKRHIAIDVETERAKLHALLNSSQSGVPGQKSSWEDDGSDSSRRSSSSHSLQPPPAHQHRQSTPQFNKPAAMPLKTPPPQMDRGGPMDLSSSLPKMSMSDMLKSPIDLSEVQDFSMASKKSSMSSPFGSSSGGGKGKLDDTLSKLMKKNNCTIEEPVVGKEKKRKKLDEIVLGLSAAKEQKTFPDPSLPSSKKQPITPSVSVTPANLSSPVPANQNQKPFTITVTSVPGKSSKGSSSQSMSQQAAAAQAASSGLAALQNMAMGGAPSKESLNALLAQTMQNDPQTFLKQQQKMMQSLPASQRKAYEGMLAEMKQAMELSSKYSAHDAKVNKWLAEQSVALNEQLSMDYRRSTRQHASGSGSSRGDGGNSSLQSQMSKAAQQAQQQQEQQQQQQQAQQQAQQRQQQQQQQAMGPQSLTGDESVPVIHKQTGKRLSGNKAPQLKRLMQWLTENPAYEVDPKWLEMMQNPMSAPSPKPSPMDSGSMNSGSSGKNHGGRPSSTSSNTSSSGLSAQQQQAQQQSKKARQNALDQANAMQFANLAGMNPNLLAGLPGFGGFDAKSNPLLMPFGGMPGLGGMSGLGNLNNMNLFANLAGLGGLGNLAGMDTQSLAALMAAAGTAGLGNLTGPPTQSGKSGGSQSSNKKGKSDSQQGGSGSSQGGSSSSKVPTSTATSAASNMPFLFPNPGLLYPPLGLGGLNPYSLGSGMNAYDQLAQQYNLLNGGNNQTPTSSSSSKSHQSQGKSSSSRSSMSSANMGASTSTSSSGRGRNSASSRAAAANEMAQLSNLLMPTADPLLLESISRMAGMDIAQATRLMAGLGQPPAQSSSDKRSSQMSSKEAAEKQAAKEQQKWMESLARGAMTPDLASLQAFAQGKLPTQSQSSSSKGNSSKSSSSSQQLPPIPADLSQAFFAEMAAQAMAAAANPGSMAGLGGGGSSSSSKRSRDQEMKDAFEQFSKQQMDLYTRTLGLGAGISLIPTSSSSSLSDDHKPKRSRNDSHASSGSKDDGIPLNLGSMSHIEKSLRGVGSGSSASDSIDKVTLTPLSSAGIAANLPSQTTITIAPPISSGASSSSERSERSESRISLTITNAADAAKLPPPYEEADELIIQPILKKVSDGDDESRNSDERRSSSRLKRPRGGSDHGLDAPPEKRRELRSTRHTRQSETLNLSTSSDNDTDKGH